MVDTARRLLDQLMGPGRDGVPLDPRPKSLDIHSSEVCKDYLCGFCPRDAFRGTGVLSTSTRDGCDRRHVQRLRVEFQRHRAHCDGRDVSGFKFERSLLRRLEEIARKRDKKVRALRRKLRPRSREKDTILDSSGDEIPPPPPLPTPEPNQAAGQG